MKKIQTDPDFSMMHLYEAIRAAQALADRLQLSTVGIRLDGALVELDRVMRQGDALNCDAEAP